MSREARPCQPNARYYSWVKGYFYFFSVFINVTQTHSGPFSEPSFLRVVLCVSSRVQFLYRATV